MHVGLHCVGEEVGSCTYLVCCDNVDSYRQCRYQEKCEYTKDVGQDFSDFSDEIR